MRSRLHAGWELVRHRQLRLYISDHGTQVTLRRRPSLEISPLRARVIRLEAESSRLYAARIPNCDCGCFTFWGGSTYREIALKGEKLDVIPLLCKSTGRHRRRCIFSPSVVGPPHHQGVVEVTQSGHVAVISIHPCFFVACTDDQPCIAILPKQKHISFNRVVGP